MPTGTATTNKRRAAVADLFGSLSGELSIVEQRLQTELTSRYATVDAVVRHGYRLGGKRLRPALVLLTAQACGEIDEGHLLLATVVEMIHTATLVHDDVLDEANLRRHVDTVNARWGNETSVLLGDFLFSHAFYLASTLGTADYCRVIGRATNRVCEGEMLQTLGERNFDLTEREYLEIIDAKTAELCACCCELGAWRTDADPEIVDAMSAYGRNLGMAFQIADDLLDLVGDERQTGKSLGRDLAKGKLTLPLIHARESLVDGAQTRFVQQLATGTLNTDELTMLLRETGSLEYTRRAAAGYVERAQDCLTVIADGGPKQMLHEVASFVVQRHS